MYLRLLLFTCLLVFSIRPVSAEVLDYIVALVDSEVILKSEFDEFRAIAAYNRPQQQLTDRQLLDEMILRRIELNRAKQVGIRISDNQLNQRLVEEARKQGYAPETIISDFADFPGGIESYRNYLRDNITIHELQAIAIRSRITITEHDARSFLITEQGRNSSRLVYELAFLSMPSDRINQPDQADILEEIIVLFRQNLDFDQQLREIQSMYSWVDGKQLAPRPIADLPTVFANIAPLLHRQEVYKPIVEDDTTYLLKVLNITGIEPHWRTMVRSRHILLKPSVIRNDEQTRLLISQIRQRIVDGELFETVAKTYTEDQETKSSGGDLGWQSLDFFTPEFSTQIEQLPLLALSQPFRTPFGWHIAQVLERRQEDVSEQLEIDAIRNYLFQQRVNDELPRWLNQLRETSYVEILDPGLVSSEQ